MTIKIIADDDRLVKKQDFYCFFHLFIDNINVIGMPSWT